MANANIARGLVPYKYYDGSRWNGAANIYSVPAAYGTALYIGDPLVVAGSADGNGIPTIQIATAAGGAYITGVMVGIVSGGEPVVGITRDLSIYHPASTNQYILVADDPRLLFMVQEDSVGGSLAATDVSNNVDLIAGSGSTTTGYSGWMLDSSTVQTTATLQMRLVRLLHQADNAIGTNAKWLARINLHTFLNTTGT